MKKAADTNDPMLERYIKAVKDVKEECRRVIPIKVSNFTADHKVHTCFFKFLTSMGAIEKVMEGKIREGSLFEWNYKPASNESETLLPLKLLGMARSYDAKYAADKVLKNKDPKQIAKKHEKQKQAETAKGLKGAANRQEAIIRYLVKPYEDKLAEKLRTLQLAQQEYNETLAFVNKMYKELGLS